MVLFKVSQIIRGTRCNNIVPQHDSPLLYYSIAFQLFEIFQIQVLDMVNQNEIIWSIFLNCLLQSCYCACMDMNAVSHSCNLRYFVSNFPILGADLNCMDSRFWHQLGKSKGRVSAVSSYFKYVLYLLERAVAFNNLGLFRAKIHHPIFLGKDVNFLNSLFQIPLGDSFGNVIEQSSFERWVTGVQVNICFGRVGGFSPELFAFGVGHFLSYYVQIKYLFWTRFKHLSILM